MPTNQQIVDLSHKRLIERRKSVRREIHVPATLASLGKRHEITILNISDGGAKLAACLKLPLQSEVILHVLELRVALKASIVWRAEAELGVRF